MRKFVIIISVLILTGVDLFIKYVLENSIGTSQYRPIISQYIGLKLSYNTGIAFSLPIRGITLQFLTACILLFFIYYYAKEEYSKNSRLIDIGYICIFSGAISHAYERIFVGHVVDFIAVKYFAILNFADILLSVGAIILVIAYGFSGGRFRK